MKALDEDIGEGSSRLQLLVVQPSYGLTRRSQMAHVLGSNNGLVWQSETAVGTPCT